MKTALKASAALLALQTAPALAQQAIDLPEVIVYSNLGGIEADRTGTSVTVLDEEDLLSNGETSVARELARLPGVAVADTGPVGSQTTVTIRGVNQNNIAVRYEGIDISDPSGPQVAYDFGGLTSGAVGRIDVLRGSQSALFGSEAVGGAILMQGKRASGPGSEFDAQLEFGSYNTRQAAINWAAASERGEFSLGISRFQTDGFSSWEENGRPGAEADGYEESRVNLFASYNLGEDTTVEFAGFGSNSSAGFDTVFGTFASDDANFTNKTQRAGRLSVIHDFGGAQIKASLSRYDIKRDLDYSGFILPYEGRRDSAQIEASFALGQAIEMTAGIERTIETYSDSNQREVTTVDSFYAEAVYAINPDNDITLSLRRDEHSQFGGQWAGRLNGAHRMGNDLTLRWSAGTGYRAPSNYELFGFYYDFATTPPVQVAIGDPTLGVERSNSFDIGVQKDFGNATLTATAFYLEATDLIDYSFASGSYTQRAGKSKRTGIELSGDWQINDRLALSAGYTLTNSSTSAALDSSGWAVSAPRHTLSAAVKWDVTDRLHMGVDMLAVGGKPGLSDYAVFNLAAAYEVSEGVETYVRIDNLLDREYQAFPGYGTSDRAAFFGIRASF